MKTSPEESQSKDIQTFFNCYIEASGPIDFTWKLSDISIGLRYRFIAYWPVVFKEPATDVTIYSKKNGEILWEDSFESDEWVMYLVGFIGKYNNDGSTDETLIANLEGKVSFLMVSPEWNDKCDVTNQDHESVCSSTLNHKILPTNTQGRYMNCYIEISGYLHNDWPAIVKLPNMVQILWTSQSDSLEKVFGLYTYILFEEDTAIKVYDEKGGELLWQHDGTIDPMITLIGFSGEYSYDEPDPVYSLPIITLKGNAGFLSIKLHEYPEP
jgi:hypothetical protein